MCYICCTLSLPFLWLWSWLSNVSACGCCSKTKPKNSDSRRWVIKVAAAQRQLTWQRLPEKPGGHRQWKPLTSSWQRPPLRHGPLEHSSTSVSQRSPPKPRAHTHLKPFTRSWMRDTWWWSYCWESESISLGSRLTLILGYFNFIFKSWEQFVLQHVTELRYTEIKCRSPVIRNQTETDENWCQDSLIV